VGEKTPGVPLKPRPQDGGPIRPHPHPSGRPRGQGGGRACGRGLAAGRGRPGNGHLAPHTTSSNAASQLPDSRQPATSQPPASHQPATSQSARRRPAASQPPAGRQPTASQPPASLQPGTNQLPARPQPRTSKPPATPQPQGATATRDADDTQRLQGAACGGLGAGATRDARRDTDPAEPLDCSRPANHKQISIIQPQRRDWIIAPDLQIKYRYQSPNHSATIG